MPLSSSTSGSGPSDDKFRKIERALQDAYEKYFPASLRMAAAILGGRYYADRDAADITSMAWDKVGRRMAEEPRKYLQKKDESEENYSKRLIGLLIKIIKDLVKDSDRYARRRLPSDTQHAPAHFNNPHSQDERTSPNPWLDVSSDPRKLAELNEFVLGWADGLADEPGQIVKIYVDWAPDIPSREEIRAELEQRLQTKLEPEDIARWSRQLKTKARQHLTLRSLFYSL